MPCQDYQTEKEAEARGFLRTKKGTHTMSQQAEHEQQPLTPKEMRQHLTELGIDQQAITELSDEQLEEIAGGGSGARSSKWQNMALKVLQALQP